MTSPAMPLDVLASSLQQPEDDVFLLNYDPPLAIPFTRRNEVVAKVGGP